MSCRNVSLSVGAKPVPLAMDIRMAVNALNIIALTGLLANSPMMQAMMTGTTSIEMAPKINTGITVVLASKGPRLRPTPPTGNADIAAAKAIKADIAKENLHVVG